MFHFAQLMPRHILLDYAKKFGVGEKPELRGFKVGGGYLPSNDPKDWSIAQYANFSFGQGMMITPLQLAQIGGVVAKQRHHDEADVGQRKSATRVANLKTFAPEVKAANVIKPETATKSPK